MESKKMLKIYGIVFIVLALIDVAEFAVQYFFGNLTPAYIAGLIGCEPSQATTYILITGAAMLVVALLKLFLGIRAVNEANGANKGTGYIGLAKTLLVIMGILFIVSIVTSITQHVIDWSSICTYLIGISCLLGLIQHGKAVK